MKCAEDIVLAKNFGQTMIPILCQRKSTQQHGVCHSGVCLVALLQSCQVIQEAPELLVNGSDDVLYRSKAIKEHGIARAFDGSEDMCTLFREAFVNFFLKLAMYGTLDELDVGKAPVALDAADLWNNASDCMRLRTKIKGLPLSALSQKEETIRSVPLLERLRTCSSALDQLDKMRQ